MEIALDKIKNVKIRECVKILESTKSRNPTGSQQVGPASFYMRLPPFVFRLFTILKYLLFRALFFSFPKKECLYLISCFFIPFSLHDVYRSFHWKMYITEISKVTKILTFEFLGLFFARIKRRIFERLCLFELWKIWFI